MYMRRPVIKYATTHASIGRFLTLTCTCVHVNMSICRDYGPFAERRRIEGAAMSDELHAAMRVGDVGPEDFCEMFNDRKYLQQRQTKGLPTAPHAKMKKDETGDTTDEEDKEERVPTPPFPSREPPVPPPPSESDPPPSRAPLFARVGTHTHTRTQAGLVICTGQRVVFCTTPRMFQVNVWKFTRTRVKIGLAWDDHAPTHTFVHANLCNLCRRRL